MQKDFITNLLSNNDNSDAIALISQKRNLTYKNLSELIDAAVNGLKKLGIKHGDMVGLTLTQSPTHMIIIMALLKIGAISVPLAAIKSMQERTEIAKKYHIKFLITFDDRFGLQGTSVININKINTIRLEAQDTAPDHVMNVDSQTPLRLVLSSGTTGKIKGVMLTQDDILNRVNQSLIAFTNKTRLLSFDLNYAMGLIFNLSVLKEGGTIVFPGADIKNIINVFGVTDLILSPVQASELIKQSQGKNSFSSINRTIVVGEYCPVGLIHALKDKITNNIYNTYGLSEIGGVSITIPEILPTQDENLAKGIINKALTVEIVNSKGKILPAMESGRVRIKSKTMPKGYYLDPEMSAECFKKGYYYSGDRGFITEEGYLCIEGRYDDLINIGGEVIDPIKIEKIVNQHQEVVDSIAFAVKSPLGVNELALAIAGTEEADRKELEAFCAKNIKPYPKHFFYLDDLPKNSNGKVLRNQIPELFENQGKSPVNV
jgi:acyl-coenzyme A synthetase/AMP-(fatty) acid ligase